MAKEFRSAALHYAVAVVAVAAAGGIRAAFHPTHGVYSPIFVPFILAIVVAGWLGGRGPSLAAAACSVLAVWYFFSGPRYSFGMANPAHLEGLVRFALVCVLVSLLVGQLRASRVAAARCERHLRVATLSAEVGVWSRTLGTTGLAVSANWRRLFGIAPDVPVTVDTWHNAVHPEDRDRAAGELHTASGHHRDFKTEYRTLWPDGTVRWIMDHGRVSYGRHGRAVGLAGISVDITERKQAEEMLRRTGAELREAERIAHVGGWYWDLKTDIVTASEESFRVYGLDPSLPMPNGRDHERLFTAESRARLHAAARGAMQGASYELDVEMLRADGGNIWITTRGEPVLDTDGNFVGIRGTAQDITERKRAEYALRESEAQFRTLANAIPQLCWMAHADGGVFWYNQRWYEYTGTVLEEMEGWGWQSVHDPEVLPKVLERWQASITAGTPVDMVFPLRGADGEYRPFLTRAMPVRDRDGKLARWFGTSTDISELRRIEEALQRVSEQRRLALEAAELGTWDYRVDAGIVFMDERCLEIYGLPPGGSAGIEETTEQIHSEDRPGVRETVKQAFAGTDLGVYGREYRVVWPDGSVHWVAAHGRVYFEGEGDQRRAVHFTGVSADITERRRAEQLLRESEERLALAIDATHLGTFDFYPQTGKLIWSDSAKRHFGLPPSAQVSFDTFLRGLHPNDAGRTREVVRNVLRPGSDGQYAAEYRTIGIEDGIERWLSAWGRVIFDPQGQPVRLIGVTLDITERKRLEEALLEGEATTRTLLETASQAIMAASADGAIVMANRMAEDMFGYQPDELLGRPLDTLLPPDVRERLRALRADFDSNPQPHTMATGLELQGLRKDGSIFPIEVSLSRVQTIRGRLAVSFVTDITQRKRAEMDLRNRERELRALAGSLLTAQEDERRRMARELHDDVTQRLAILSIEIGKLAARADLSVKETRAQLRSLQKQVIELSHEVRRLSHGLHPAVIEDFGLGTALEELCEEFGKATGISVRFDGPNDDAGLSRDVAASLYRIAQESLGNAAKHARATEVRVALCVNGGNMQLLVSDNGAGFSGEPWRSRIGLGIVSMKERVRMVNGTLSIASRPGQGTEIIASVPLSGGDGETGANSTG